MAYNLYIISNKLFEPLILEQSVSETWCEDTQQRRREVVTNESKFPVCGTQNPVMTSYALIMDHNSSTAIITILHVHLNICVNY
jgi:hypothetical protein